MVRLLLEKCADINGQGGEYGNALQAASAGGSEKVVRLLLEKRADANAQGGKYSNALYVASAGGHERVVRLLLEKGADVDAEGGHFLFSSRNLSNHDDNLLAPPTSIVEKYDSVEACGQVAGLTYVDCEKMEPLSPDYVVLAHPPRFQACFGDPLTFVLTSIHFRGIKG